MTTKKYALAFAAILFLSSALVPATLVQGWGHSDDRQGIRHVLLVSIDGTHAVDYLNCSQGISGVNGGSIAKFNGT
jgi:hypothetical protein